MPSPTRIGKGIKNTFQTNNRPVRHAQKSVQNNHFRRTQALGYQSTAVPGRSFPPLSSKETVDKGV
jgi:hypothetical protein